ncbi:MAG: hypothetical protein EPN92_04930 [Chitinophagaceae bacterium]|nr:MAG: hypothetical protein EPN92_04930 [Chitinophagaceae bacterium]
MLKNCTTILAFLLIGICSYSQGAAVDTTIKPPKDEILLDSTVDYDLLMDDLESFLDSISSPHSYFMGSLAMGKGYFNFKSKSEVFLETAQKFTYTPTLAYFHKSGLSLATTGNVVNNENKLNLYQVSVSPGYDYLENRNLATGITYTKYFTKDSLNFYTTPLQNELYAYFTYRKWWVRPTVAMSYGWGSRTDYMEREALILDLRLRRAGITRINSTESISDFSLITSVRHDFYWLDIFSYNDHIRFTPQLSFISGTQKFGFNQSANTYATLIRTGANVLYNSENVYLDDQLDFQPLSLTMFLRTEYSIGKFFIQPQMIFDYYFPATDKNFSTLFSFNLGFVF